MKKIPTLFERDWNVGKERHKEKLCDFHRKKSTKAAEMYRQTKNIKAISLRLGYRNPAVTAEYLGIEDDDSLDLSEKVKI